MVLLTGVPGWLGNRFLEILIKREQLNPGYPELVDEEKIRCLCLPDADTSFIKRLSPDTEIKRGDISDKDSLEVFFKDSEGATLFHLAGVIHPSEGIKQFYSINVDGTQNVLDMAKKYNVKKIILMSSNSQSGCNPNNKHLFTEDSPYNPYMHYGRSKMLMEEIAKRYIQDYGMDITIIRTCWFYGPHQPERQTRFFSMIKDGKFPMLGDGTNVRSMSYVDNSCQGMLLAAGSPSSNGKIYWITDEKPYSINEIIATVGDVLENEFSIKVRHGGRRFPDILGDIAYFVDYTIQGLGIYNKEIHVLSELNKNIACSIKLAKEELDYRPQISLREGMIRSIQWCLENGQHI